MVGRMKAEELYEILKKYGIELKSRSLFSFESYEKSALLRGAKWITVSYTVNCKGVWRNYYAGFVVDSNGNVVGVYATYYFRDEEWNYTSSTTYVASLVGALKTKIVERAGGSVRIGEPPNEYTAWKEDVSEREVEIPALPPELAKKLVEEMRSSTYAKYVWIDGQRKEIKWPEL
jgi:hypothetical protein